VQRERVRSFDNWPFTARLLASSFFVAMAVAFAFAIPAVSALALIFAGVAAMVRRRLVLDGRTKTYWVQRGLYPGSPVFQGPFHDLVAIEIGVSEVMTSHASKPLYPVRIILPQLQQPYTIDSPFDFSMAADMAKELSDITGLPVVETDELAKARAQLRTAAYDEKQS
jgi:hypothetical protein